MNPANAGAAKSAHAGPKTLRSAPLAKLNIPTNTAPASHAHSAQATWTRRGAAFAGG
jgi:hypothetical protein